MNTFRIVQRESNSWVRESSRDYYSIRYECPHKHRSLTSAVRCLRTIDNTTRGINAKIEYCATDQLRDGKLVDYYETQDGKALLQ